MMRTLGEFEAAEMKKIRAHLFLTDLRVGRAESRALARFEAFEDRMAARRELAIERKRELSENWRSF